MSIAATTVDVLNASFEPLSTTHLNRAMALVLGGRAEIIEADESRTIRALGATFSFPRVIRMLKYIRVPFTYSQEYWSRACVLRRDNNTCAYCGKTAEQLKSKMTIDHIQPQSRGGIDTWTNTITACVKDNSKKADKTLEEIGMVLLFEPTIPMRIYLRSGQKRKRQV